MSIIRIEDDEEIDIENEAPTYREICETNLKQMSPPFKPYLLT